MLVFADRVRIRRPREMLATIDQLARGAHGLAPDARRDALTHALVEAGELAQGLADAAMQSTGVDDLTPVHTAPMALATALARQLLAGGAAPVAELAAVAALPLGDAVRCKVAEGYAFYAVYPEAYAQAARSWDWGEPPLAVGLRSIGASLAAVAAAATGGEAISLRPVGPPFARELRVSARLRDALAAHGGPFAVVDEGPGLSGSSFGAAADLLESLGVAPQRIVFLPSHGGDVGPAASPRHRRRWATAARPVRTFDDLNARDPAAGWFEDLIGEALRVEDLSAGAWRSDPAAPRDAPTSGWQERRKLRITTAQGTFLARFAGLGAAGEAKLARGRALANAGFTPEPLALRRGLLLERWVDGRPLAQAPRRRFLAHLGRYLGFRARALPAKAAGADLAALQEMAALNAGELCGAETAGRLEARLADLVPQIGDLQPVQIDGRLHAWEWRVRPDGAFCKTDALDHCEGHDLVGCQDCAWDLAGAAVEFDLTPAELAGLIGAVEREAGRAVSRPAIAAFATCYAAFQGGAWSLVLSSLSGHDAEAVRRQVDRYAAWLARDAQGQGRRALAPLPALDARSLPGA